MIAVAGGGDPGTNAASRSSGVTAPGYKSNRPPSFLRTLTLTLGFILGSPLWALDSEPAPRAAQSLLLDITFAGSRLVAVGDRGHVLLSDDDGRTWRQVIVPTRAMLTSVTFADSAHGWAVGHDGVILATTDGGDSWIRQQATEDIATIFLDVYFVNARTGWAIGAYGKFLTTTDGGANWKSAQPSEEEIHFNAMTANAQGGLVLAGEAGTLLVSSDHGGKWQRRQLNYEGSLFGLLAGSGHELWTYGLQGSAFVSLDDGKSWTESLLPEPVLIQAGVRLKSDALLFAGAGGNFFIRRATGGTFATWKPDAYRGAVAGLLEAQDGALVVVGELGVARLQLPLK